MSLGRDLDREIQGSGTFATEQGGSEASVDVIEADRLGVRVRAVKVRREAPADVVERAGSLPERLRTLPDRVAPVEVDGRLGGAVLRSLPEDMREREFFQLDVGPNETVVRRYRADDGGRSETDWTMTREQLGRLVDELDQP